jgi:hypothetical protein
MNRVTLARTPSRQQTTATRATGANDPATTLAVAQGVYYALTGVWALADSRSFQAITGPKVDVWLVKTVAVLVTAIGATLRCAGLNRRVTPEIRRLAVGSAVGLAGIDIYYVAKGRISQVYLLDAAAELGLAAGWALVPKAEHLEAEIQ